MVEILGIIAAVILPFFNIPLMVKIHQRKSSSDISIIWTMGIFSSMLLMLPSAILSEDLIFKLFAIMNALLFSGVVYCVVRYRK